MVPLYLLINCYLQNSYGSDDKEFGCNAGDLGSIPVLGGSPIEGNGNPLQYPFLENSMDREAWWATACKELDTTEWLTLKWKPDLQSISHQIMNL